MSLPQLLVKARPALANLCPMEVIGNQDLAHRFATQHDVAGGKVPSKGLDAQVLTIGSVFPGQFDHGADQGRGHLGRSTSAVGNDNRP